MWNNRFTALVTLLILFSTVKSHVFSTINEIQYDYRGLVKSATHEPALFTSEFLIKAHINILWSKNIVKINLTDVTYALYSGKGEKLNFNSKTVQMPPEAESIYKEFVVQYDVNGKAQFIMARKNDDIWSINIKRALASLFQIDMAQVNMKNIKAYGFYSDESTPYGSCRVLYNVVPENYTHTTIRKFQIPTSCDGFEWETNFNVHPNYCEAEFEKPLSISSEHIYGIIRHEKGHFIDQIETFNDITFSPFNGNGEIHSVIVTQRLKSLKIAKNSKPPQIELRDKRYHKIRLNQIRHNFTHGKIFDLTGGRRIFESKDLIFDKITVSLKCIGDYLKKEYSLLSGSMDDQGKNFHFLIHNLQLLEESDLDFYFSKLISEAKDHTQVNIKLFVQMLPHIGTFASTLFIRNLVINKKVDDNVAVTLLERLPIYVKYPDKNLLAKLSVIIQDDVDLSENVKRAGLLSFATLLSKTLKKHSEDPDLDAFVEHYINKLKTITDYRDQLLYISALKNIKIYKVVKYMESIIKNVNAEIVNNNPHFRSLAILAIKYHHQKLPEIANKMFWPIFSNTSEDLEVRTSSLNVLMSNPSMDNLLKLHRFMQDEKDEQLYKYYYAALKNLSRVVSPCYKNSARNARKILKFTTKPAVITSSIANEIFDYFDSTYGFGALLQYTVVGDMMKNGFTSIYVKIASQVANLNLNQHAFYLHIDSRNLIAHTNGEEKVDKNNALTKMSYHIIKLKNNRVVSVDFSNSVTNLWDRLMEIVREPISNTNFDIDQIVNGETVIPTDMGIPAIFFIQMPTINKVNTVVNLNAFPSNYTVKYATKITQWNHQIYGLAVYNPISDVWHGSRRVHAVDSFIPISIALSVNKEGKSISLRSYSDGSSKGFQSFVHSSVFTDDGKDGETLQSSCPDCSVNYHVTNGKQFRKKHTLWKIVKTDAIYEAGIFDCEHHIQKSIVPKLQRIFFKNYNKNAGDSDAMKIFLGMRHIWGFVTAFPLSGTCGIGFGARPNPDYPNTSTEIALNVTLDLNTTSNNWSKISTWNTSGLYKIMQNGELIESIDLNMRSTTSKDLKNTHNVLLSQNKKGKNIFNMCSFFTQIWENEKTTSLWKYYDGNKQGINCTLNANTMEWTVTSEKSKVHRKSDGSDEEFQRCMNHMEYPESYCLLEDTFYRHAEYKIKYAFEKQYYDYWKLAEDYLRYAYADYYVRYFPKEETLPGKIITTVDYHTETRHADVHVAFKGSDYAYEGVPFEDLFWFPFLLPTDKDVAYFSDVFWALDHYDNCEIKPDYIINTSGRLSAYKLQSNWVVLATNNGSFQGQWEIYAKKINDNHLAMKIKIMNETLLLYKDEREFYLQLNDKVLDHLKTGYYKESWFNYKVSEHDRQVLIHVKKHEDILIAYDGRYIKIQLPSRFNNGFSGKCYMSGDWIDSIIRAANYS